ncbi:Foldase protein PrsA precursor [Clostridium sp. N3C]|uniref:peptidylprolyl isomerase n=1 Tax=Clostridium sp. N3C TaxID=1776758 RepID=UPI00092E1756|nr:peptidylprolyl isomerase [Clostridium sp. N3C]NLZ33358.1 foldase [Clostridiales bacterium]SCN26626.1 Foldase protein PrsA precursor [Clostridium sp. N3C]
MTNSKKQRDLLITVLSVSLVVVSALAIFFAITTYKAKKDTVVARVGDTKITKDELYNTLAKHNGESALDSLINYKIIDLELKKNNLEVTDEEIQEELKKVKEQTGGEETFNQMLAYYSYTEADFKNDIKYNTGIRKLLEPTIEITEDEMKKYFEENKANYDQAEQVRASHILVADEATAKEVKAKLEAGEDFAKLAKEYSTDTGTKENGGDLGYFTKSDMVEEFSNAAFALEVNAISGPVKSKYGYHIIKVVDKKAAVEATYEDSKDEVKEAILEEKISEKANTWISEKKQEYKIEKML